MGGKIVVPEADVNISKVIKNFQLSPKDVSDFWKLFQKLDKEKTGLVPLSRIYQRFEMDRTIFTDCLLELLEIEHVCFYCFDQDKTGFVSVDDVNNLMNMLHNIQKGKSVGGTVKSSWIKLEFKADQLDFKELQKIHDAFPRLFEPAFRLQQNMMIHTLGEVWWTRKKRSMQDIKDLSREKMEQIKAKKEAKKQRKKNRKIQKNMGLLKYYFCPCFRKYYDPSATEYDKLTKEQKLEMDKQLAIQRRHAELKMKNPETAAWQKYQQKIDQDLLLVEGSKEILGQTTLAFQQQSQTTGNNDTKSKDGQAQTPQVPPTTELQDIEDGPENTEEVINSENPRSFLETKISTTARKREERAYLRGERKKQRMLEVEKETIKKKNR